MNNAGVYLNAPFEWSTVEDLRTIFAVNVFGTVNVTKAMLPLLKRGRGRIVNVTSLTGRLPLPYYSLYTMSKHALEGFSDCLRMEMRQFGVSVHIIEPTHMSTSMTDTSVAQSILQGHWDRLDQKTQQEYGEDFLTKCKSDCLHNCACSD